MTSEHPQARLLGRTVFASRSSNYGKNGQHRSVRSFRDWERSKIPVANDSG